MSKKVRKIYLCRPNLSPICHLNGVETDSVSINTHVKDFDELSFTVNRYINIDGKFVQSNGYEYLNVAMYLHVEDYGYFRMEYPTLRNDGNKQTKDVTAYSIQKEVFNTDWVGLKINTAEEDSQEMLIDGNVTGYAMPINLISFHNPYDERFSLLNILISKTPLWKVGYIDPYLYRKTNDDGEFIQETKKSPTGQDIPQTFTSSGRWIYNDDGQFVYQEQTITEPKYELRSVGMYNEENVSIYAFLTSTLGPKVGALFFFDTENRLIHAISKYSLEHDDVKYDTGIFVGFRNLANNVDLSVEEDSIVTRVNCEGGEGLNFLDLNYGSTRLYDLSYFAHEPYMTEETAAKVLAWQELIESKRAEYKELAQEAIRISDEITDLTYRVPADENYWKTWDGMNEEGLNRSLAYYQNELSMLQESVDETPQYDSEGKYIMYNQDKTDEWYETRLSNSENGYGGYGTYFETVTYIIPNIQTALNNLYLVSTDPNYQEPNKNVEYDWELYGIVELEAQIKNLTNQFDSLKHYYGEAWPDVETPEAAQIMASHAWNKEFYLKQRTEYLKLYGEIGPNGSAYRFLDSLYQKRDGTDRTGTPISDQAVSQSMNGQLSAIMRQMAPYKSYYNLSEYFNEEDLSQIYPLLIDTDYSNTNIQMQETDTAMSKIDVEQELLDDCLDKVSELCQPQISFTSELDNLYRIEKFDALSKDLKLLNYIHLAVRDDYIVKLRVVGIQWNPCDITSSLTLQFSNMITSRSGRTDFTDIINSENNRGQRNSISIGANGQIGGSGESIEYLTNLMEALSGTGIFKKKVKNTVQNPVSGVSSLVSDEAFTMALKTVPGMSRFVLDSAQVAALDSGETVMTGGKIKTGFLNAQYIAVSKISAPNYVDDPQSVYSQTGMCIYLDTGVDPETGALKHAGAIKAPNFAIDEDGNAYFRGEITTGSTIRGATLIGSVIKNAEQDPTFSVTADGTITSIALIDPEDPNSGTWSTVISGGSIVSNHITSSTISGSTVTGTTVIGSTIQNDASNPTFSVSSTGVITSTNANNTSTTTINGGKITTNSASIGGWNIDSNSIYYGTKSTGTSNGDITLMSSSTFTRSILGGNKTGLKFAIGSRFGVAQDGTVYANYLNAQNVTISGTITATQGTIGNCSIVGGNLQIGSANIAETLSGKIINGGQIHLTPTDGATTWFEITRGAYHSFLNNTYLHINNSLGDRNRYVDYNIYGVFYNTAYRSPPASAGTEYWQFGNRIQVNAITILNPGNSTSGPNCRLTTGDNPGQIWYASTTSTIRVKNVIRELSNLDVQKMFSIPTFQFKYIPGYINQKDERCNTPIPGFIAEEIDKVIPIAVDHDEKGLPEMWNNNVMVPLMFQMIKSNRSQIDDLKQRIKKLEGIIENLTGGEKN